MKYLEFKITSYTNDEVKEKPELIDAHKTQEPTERGSVSISAESARVNNYYKHSTGLYYELAEVPVEVEKVVKKMGRPKKQK